MEKPVDLKTVNEWFEKKGLPLSAKAKFVEAHTSSSRKAAIRSQCIECCGGSLVEVRKCTAKSCSLWRFRLTG